MSALRNPIIVVGAPLYALHLFLKFSETPVPAWVSSYFADLLCMPLLLTAALYLLRWIKKRPELLLSLPMIVFAWLYCSFIFEWLLPRFNNAYTSDIVDILIYALGSAVFAIAQAKTIWFKQKSLTALR